MPPRLMIGAILLFWLGMTAWLIQREVVPMMLAEVSPTYVIDLTDEIGSPLVGWKISLDGKQVGSATSQVFARDDHTYEFHSHIRFEDFKFGPLEITKMHGTYRVTDEGKLIALLAKLHVKLHDAGTWVGIRGEVVRDAMEPVLFMNDIERKIDTIDLSEQGSIINPMHPVNRLRGLRKGQIWKVTMLDPFRGVQDKLFNDIAKRGMSKPALIAEVKLDTLAWDRKEVPCHKIEYYEPGKNEVVARTWARRTDGLVLRQEAMVPGFDLVLERLSN